MNSDNDFVKKKLFWVLVGVAIPLELLVIVLASWSVSGAVEAQKKKLKDELGKARSPGDIIGKAHIEEAKKELQHFASGEALVHKRAYGSQKSLMTWAEEFERDRAFTDGIFAVEVTVYKTKPEVKAPSAPPANTGGPSLPPNGQPGVGTPKTGNPTPGVPKPGGQKPDTQKPDTQKPGAPNSPPGSNVPQSGPTSVPKKEEKKEGGFQELVGQLLDVGLLADGKAPIWVLDENGEFKRDKNGAPVIKIVRPTYDIKITDANGATYTGVTNFSRAAIFLPDTQKKVYLKVKYLKGKYYGDKITKEEYSDYRRTYNDQIAKLLAIVNPLRPDGTGVVQFKIPLGSQASSLGGEAVSGPFPGAPGAGPSTTSKGWRYDPENGKAVPDKAYPWLNWVPEWPKWVEGTGRRKLAFKEVWTAQEDIWIQTELFHLIKKANGYVSNFKVHPGDTNHQERAKFSGTRTERTSQIYFLQNPYWTMQLQLVQKAGGALKENILKVRVFNRLVRRQSTDVKFKITLVKPSKDIKNPTPPQLIHLPSNGLDEQKRVPLSSLAGSPDERTAQGTPWLEFRIREDINPTGIYKVEQVLTWQTAAVKRIDQVVIGSGKNPGGGETSGTTTPGAEQGFGVVNPGAGGAGGPTRPGLTGGVAMGSSGLSAQSHRTVSELKPFPAFKSEEKSSEGATTPTTGPGGTAMPGPGNTAGIPSGPPMPPGGSGTTEGPGGPGQNPFAKPGSGSMFDFKRYVEVGGRTRKVPVGVSLIVDQQHVGLVLAAFSNSRLRFLTTQVLLNRYPDSVRPGTQDDTSPSGGSGDLGRPGIPGGPGLGGYGLRPGGRPGQDPETGYPGTTGTTNKKSETTSEMPESNMELVVYGIMSIYQRYPAKPEGASGGSSGDAGKTGTPTAGGPPGPGM